MSNLSPEDEPPRPGAAPADDGSSGGPTGSEIPGGYVGYVSLEGRPDGYGELQPVTVTRLVTFVDVDDDDDPGPEASSMSVSARHEAELDDGRRVLLLDDRGWSGSGPPNIWARESVEQLEEQARTVVGPDEPMEEQGETHEVMAAFHYGMLVGMLRQQGILTGAVQLQRMPHDVELSERVLARLGHDPGSTGY